jgi:hypothetical protein
LDPLGAAATDWPMIIMMENFWWNEDWQGKLKYSEKTYPSATLSTINPTLSDTGLKPGRLGGKPATNRLSYGAAFAGGYSLSFFGCNIPKPMDWEGRSDTMATMFTRHYSS